MPVMSILTVIPYVSSHPVCSNGTDLSETMNSRVMARALRSEEAFFGPILPIYQRYGSKPLMLADDTTIASSSCSTAREQAITEHQNDDPEVNHKSGHGSTLHAIKSFFAHQRMKGRSPQKMVWYPTNPVVHRLRAAVDPPKTTPPEPPIPAQKPPVFQQPAYKPPKAACPPRRLVEGPKQTTHSNSPAFAKSFVYDPAIDMVTLANVKRGSVTTDRLKPLKSPRKHHTRGVRAQRQRVDWSPQLESTIQPRPVTHVGENADVSPTHRPILRSRENTNVEREASRVARSDSVDIGIFLSNLDRKESARDIRSDYINSFRSKRVDAYRNAMAHYDFERSGRPRSPLVELNNRRNRY